METLAKTETGMSLEDFLEAYHIQPFELINGERKLLMTNVVIHGKIIGILIFALKIYIIEQQMGEVLSETTFILPDTHNRNWVKGSRSPDVMFYCGNRAAEYEAVTPDWRIRPYPIVPDLVVEVVSPTDRYSDINAKVQTYLRDGVRLIWVIDPQSRIVTIHAPDLENPLVLHGDATLTGGEVLPGFQITLATLFV
jgi:Uma2 family endonuclease